MATTRLHDAGYGEAQTLNNLGTVYADQGRWQDAIDSYEQSLQTLRELGDRHGEAQTLGNLGLALRSSDEEDEAIHRLDAALRIFEEIGAPEAEQVRDLLTPPNRPRRKRWLRWRGA